MDKKVPIHIRPSAASEQAPPADAPLAGQEQAEERPRESSKTSGRPELAETTAQLEPAATQAELEALEESLEVWRDRALRLQAERENFRKRQQRLAEERIAEGRERVLRSFLQVADDLERVLNADEVDVKSLRQGVNLTYQTLLRLLAQEGVEPIQAVGQPFDPAWHEAVGTIPYQNAGVEPNTVVELEQEGYRLGDRLLRPARVIVAA